MPYWLSISLTDGTYTDSQSIPTTKSLPPPETTPPPKTSTKSEPKAEPTIKSETTTKSEIKSKTTEPSKSTTEQTTQDTADTQGAIGEEGISGPQVSEESEPKRKAIPKWVKSNAKWWSQGAIEDREFASGIEFLIKEKIMTLEGLQVSSQPQTSEPTIQTKTLSLNKKEFTLPRSSYETEMVTLQGFIDDYQRGASIYLQIEDPLGDVEEHNIRVGDDKYTLSFMLQKDSPEGTYNIKTIYKEEIYDFISFTVGAPSSPGADEINIPKWIKTTAGWWADGQISEKEFVEAIKHLIKEGIIRI